MIDRRGFFAFAFNAVAAGVLIAAPAMALDGPNHRRRARYGASKPQQEVNAAQADAAFAPNHQPNQRRGRQRQAQAAKPEAVAELEPAVQPAPFDVAPRRSRR